MWDNVQITDVQMKKTSGFPFVADVLIFNAQAIS